MPSQEFGLQEVIFALIVKFMEKTTGYIFKTVCYNIVAKWSLQLHVQNKNNNMYMHHEFK